MVEYFPDTSYKDKQIFSITRLQSSIKYDVKAFKPYTLGKAHSMALTFEAKNVELAKKKKYLFDVSRKDHSNGKKVGCRINPKSFHVHRDKATPDRAANSTTKTKHNTE